MKEVIIDFIQAVFAKMRKCLALLLILGFCTALNAQNIVYIDPENSSDAHEDGSINHPYDSWHDVTWLDGYTYLQKRNTRFVTTESIQPNASNIKIGAYGVGKKPAIEGNMEVKIIDVYNHVVTIENFEIYAAYQSPVSGISVAGESAKIIIDSCIIHDAEWGIRIMNINQKSIIRNTIVYNTQDDGIFTQNIHDIDILNCYVYNVNLLWHTDIDASGGDCIQLAGDHGYAYIAGNTLDHSSTGKKFCLIIGSASPDGHADSVLLEDNILIGNAENGTTGIYVKASIEKLILNRNTITNCSYGIITYSEYPLIMKNNRFYENKKSVYLTYFANAFIFNNTFYNDAEAMVYGSHACDVELYNNLFYLTNETSQVYEIYGNLKSDYNCFNRENSNFLTGIGSLSEWQTQKGLDMNSFVADPNVVDISKYDFSLKPNSSCIDKGKDADRNTDFMGNLAPFKGKHDIGAYEYSSVIDPTKNYAPIASFVANVDDFTVPASVEFNASGSYDLNGDDLTYTWDFGDGNKGTGKTIEYEFTSFGNYSVNLVVSDGELSGTYSKTISINESEPNDNQAPTVKVISPVNNAKYSCSENIVIGVNASDTDGSIQSVKFYLDDSLVSTLYNSPYTTQLSHKYPGVYQLYAVAKDNEGSETTSASVSITIVSNAVNEPFNGEPWNLPCRIEAELYDQGGQNVSYYDQTFGNQYTKTCRDDDVDIEACFDDGGGCNIAAVSQGEWLKYTVNVERAGTYRIKTRTASVASDKMLRIEFDHDTVIDVNVPHTGDWQDWETSESIVHLSAGQKSMTLSFISSLININWIEVELIEADDYTALSLHDNAINDNLKVYPNPVESGALLTIENIDYAANSVKLYDSFGRLIYKAQLQGHQSNVSTHGLPSGLYILKVGTDVVAVSRKILIH